MYENKIVRLSKLVPILTYTYFYCDILDTSQKRGLAIFKSK